MERIGHAQPPLKNFEAAWLWSQNSEKMDDENCEIHQFVACADTSQTSASLPTVSDETIVCVSAAAAQTTTA